MPAASNSLEAWRDFYMFIGAASATLLGLLFVAISLHLNRTKQRVLQAVAGQTYSNFLIVIILAALFLIPAVNSDTIAWSLLIIGCQGLARAMVRMWFAAGSSTWRQVIKNQGVLRSLFRVRGYGGLHSDVNPLWNFFGPIACYAAMIIVAYRLFRGEIAALYSLVAVTCALIVIATGAAWDFLVIGNIDDQSG